jgi:demethylmenaquinone methyltransferase/2-methoxy-6-polyprenyl-1,4-benzoquinol methylase
MQKLADAIMLFYDAEEADRMFREAGYTDIHHYETGPSYDPDVALVTIARDPEDE